MLVTRLITAGVLIAAFLAAELLLQDWQFAILVLAVVLIAGMEWARLCGLAAARAYGFGGALAAIYALLTVAMLSRGGIGVLLGVCLLASLFWMILAPLWLRAGVVPDQRRWLLLTGALLIPCAGMAMVALFPWKLLAALALVWVADTAAYFAGRAFGRRKLAPSISPGKTLEGAAAATFAAALYAIILAMASGEAIAIPRGWAWLVAALLAVGMCWLSICGDLFESALKRQAGVKDSGTLLPGHGGVLDRVDSALATLPVAVLIAAWIVLP